MADEHATAGGGATLASEVCKAPPQERCLGASDGHLRMCKVLASRL